jgi:hypothetical protein
MLKTIMSEKMQAYVFVWSEARLRRVLMAWLAALSGFLLALILSSLCRQIGAYLFPPSPIIYLAEAARANADSSDAIRQSFSEDLFIIIASGIFLGTFGGAYAALRVVKQDVVTGWSVGFLMAIETLFSFAALNYPLWSLATIVVLCVLAAYGGGLLGQMINAKHGQPALYIAGKNNAYKAVREERPVSDDEI